MVNKAILLGNVGRKPEFRVTQGGTSVLKFSVATNKSVLNKQTNEYEKKTTWHNIVCFGSRADSLNRYLDKGSQVFIDGEIENQQYEKNGEKRWSSSIIAYHVRLVGKRTDEKNESVEQQSTDNYYDDDEIPF